MNSSKQRIATFLVSCFLILAISSLSACSMDKTPDKSWENAVKGTYSATLSSDGKQAIIGSITHGGSLWHVAHNERRFDWNHQQGKFTNIIASSFSPEGQFALTADHQTMVLWNTSSGAPLTYWTTPSEVLDLALTPNGDYALLGLADHSAVLFDVKRGGIQRSFYHQGRVRSVALSADGKLAITGSQDQTAKLWDISNGKELFNWQHQDEVVTVAISADGLRALSVAKYDKAVIWNTQTGKAIGELPLRATAIKRGQSFTSARFSADAKRLLTGNSDRLVQLWNTSTLTELARWTVPKRELWKPTSSSIAALSFSDQSNQFIVIASNGFTHQISQ